MNMDIYDHFNVDFLLFLSFPIPLFIYLFFIYLFFGIAAARFLHGITSRPWCLKSENISETSVSVKRIYCEPYYNP